MVNLRIMLVEDQQADVDVCVSAVELYKHKHGCEIDLVICKSLTEAMASLDRTFDAAIIDVTLDSDANAGLQLIKTIIAGEFRIPTAIMTGTPVNVEEEHLYIGLFIKGETQYDTIITKFHDVFNTGVTRIMGGRGTIEKALSNVFYNNIRQQLSAWVEYGKIDSDKTERALLRHVLNHLYSLVDEEAGVCFPEEMYIFPPIRIFPTTGSVVVHKQTKTLHIVVSPACDLEIRKDGNCNTDWALLAEINEQGYIVNPLLANIKKQASQESFLKRLFANNYVDYYHWLPSTSFFAGGFVNFRRVTSIQIETLTKDYDVPSVQISPFFIKDISARLAKYYARQGQPDIDSASAITRCLTAHLDPG